MVAICLTLCLSGCNDSYTRQGDQNYSDTMDNRFVPIATQKNLYYDINTKIVYVIFCEDDGVADCRAGYGYMSPYYADNGMPYKYNVNTGALEEIYE